MEIHSKAPDSRLRVSGRLRALLGLLLLVVVLRLAVHRVLLSKPALPPPAAKPADKARYYRERIQANPGDVGAYIALGALEEQGGFFTSAVNRLLSARALGAPDTALAAPLGRSLMHLGRFEEARTELEKAAAASPDSVEAAVNLAGFYDSYGKPEQTVTTLRLFAQRHPALADPTAQAPRDDVERLMLCFSEAGDSEMTLRMAEHLIKLAPNEPNGYAIAGKQFLIQNRPREAVETLSHAVALEPKMAALRYLYGVALQESGKRDDALKQWELTASLDPSALDAIYRTGGEYARRQDWWHAAEAYAKVALNARTDPRAYLLAARMYTCAGNPVEAAYAYASAAGVAGDYKTALKYAQKVADDPRPDWRQRGLWSRAQALRGLNRYPEYLQTMRALTAAGSAQDEMEIADAYHALDKTDAEADALRKALAKAPGLAGYIHHRLAIVAKLKGRRDVAEQELRQALQQEPDNADYHLEMAALLFERRDVGDRLKQAIDEYVVCERLTPKDAASWRNLGIAYEAAGDLRRAAAHLEHSLDLDPGQGPCYLELGRVYTRLGDKKTGDAMLALYRKYVAFDQERQTLTTRATQNDPGAQIALADFLTRIGDYTPAAQHYALALRADPKDTQTCRKLARLYGQFGRKDAELALERRLARLEHREESGNTRSHP